MARLAFALLLLLLVASYASALSSGGAGDATLDLALLGGGRPQRGQCRGTVAECLAQEEEEGELGSADAEGHRRALYGRNYISYGALRRDNVPCSRRGASYYNCRPGGSANPYRRGCSRITRCRG